MEALAPGIDKRERNARTYMNLALSCYLTLLLLLQKINKGFWWNGAQLTWCNSLSAATEADLKTSEGVDEESRNYHAGAGWAGRKPATAAAILEAADAPRLRIPSCLSSENEKRGRQADSYRTAMLKSWT